ncbi:MAG: NAD(P)H-dependent flavin oxidoreductase [Candidatus Izemoplasmataceae bacterium]
MKTLKIGQLEAKIPIIQGGMGVGISMANLASSVANEGAIGVISAAGVGMFENERIKDFDYENTVALTKEILKAKENSSGIIGVNIMVAMTNYKELVQSALDANVDIIFSGAGLPLDLPALLKQNTHTKIVPIISSARAAKLITKRWISKYNYVPDAFVIEGPKAGGHLGFKAEDIKQNTFTLETILQETKEILLPFEDTHNQAIPLIVAGGIYTGKDIHKFLSLGADGVQMATRFVTTVECDASDAFKQTYIDAKQEDIRLIKSPVGLPGRAIFNPYLKLVEEGKKHPFSCPYNCIITCKKEEAPYCISLALYNAKIGKLSHGFAFAGTNAYRAEKIISVHNLLDELIEEYNNAL